MPRNERSMVSESRTLKVVPAPLQSTADLRGAPETALLPLYSRALESVREDAIIRDLKAEQIVAGLDYDFPKLDGATLYHTIISLRVRRFDQVVRDFLTRHPEGVIVNLGCGLDTRFDRVDNGRAQWIEVDFASVIELRRKFLRDSPRRRFVAASITDDDLLNHLPEPSRPHLFLAEGVLMFVEPAAVERLIASIRFRFPGAELLFDAVKPLEVKARRFHPTLRTTSARLLWGLGRASSLSRLAPEIEVLDEWFYCDEAEPRLGIYRLLRFLPMLATARIIRLRLGKDS